MRAKRQRKSKLQRAVDIIERYVELGCRRNLRQAPWITGPWEKLAMAIAKELK